MLLAPIVEIFCDIDEFYKNYLQEFAKKLFPLPPGKRQRKTELSESEMMTIIILFHLSHYRTFKDFYIDCVLGQLSREFPKAVSYPRFIALMPRLLAPLTAYVLSRTGKRTRGFGAGDKGYISKKLTESLAKQGIKLITKVRKNMKQKMLNAFEKFFLYQRSIVETVIDQLKSICHIEHTRHRSPVNFLVNLVSGLAGYCLKSKKPSIGRSKFFDKPTSS